MYFMGFIHEVSAILLGSFRFSVMREANILRASSLTVMVRHGVAGSLHVSFVAVRIGREPALEDLVPVVEVQVHARIIHQCGFVQTDVEAVGRFHQQGGLYAGRGERSL